MATVDKHVRLIGNLVCNAIQILSDEQLDELIAECVSLIGVNCWWVSSQLRPAIDDIARNERQLRYDKRKAS